MSKIEDLSREYVLPFLNKACEKYGEHKQMELSRFDGYDMMSAYEEGYHQAEKDLELIWKDISSINDIVTKMLNACGNSVLYDMEMKFCQEVLKRFKNYKEQKEK